jgi:two-component system response regulator PilR (NtrC family)
MPVENILVVDDDLSLRQFLPILLQEDGYQVAAVDCAEAAIVSLDSQWPDLVLTDLNMPGMSGLELLRTLQARAAKEGRDIQVVMITAYGTTESAVEAMKAGAADYVTKPFNNDELRLVVRRALGHKELVAENTRLHAELQDRYQIGKLMGSSTPMRAVIELIHRVKDTRISCLIQGESGTGKEVVARAIHFSGLRAKAPFVTINCGAIPEALVESELFGHKKGSFTGASRDKPGLIAAANGGTLFLDEVAELPPAAQVKLLRFLQERKITPVGAVEELAVDVRILAACNVDLEDEVRQGRFREDLFYRLNVVQLDLPPLRDRGEDVVTLTRHFVARFTAEYGREIGGVAPDAMKRLRMHHFPGNVRELQNIVERAVALCTDTVIRVEDLPQLREGGLAPTEVSAHTFPEEGINLDAELAAAEKQWLVAALEVAGGNKTEAARLLKMSFRSYRYRLAKFDLDADA